MRRVPYASSAALLGLIALALPLGLGGCARQGLVDYGTAYKTVFPNQILHPGPPSAGPPEGLSGPMAVRAMEKYAADEDNEKSGQDSVFVIGSAGKAGILDNRAK